MVTDHEVDFGHHGDDNGQRGRRESGLGGGRGGRGCPHL